MQSFTCGEAGQLARITCGEAVNARPGIFMSMPASGRGSRNWSSSISMGCWGSSGMGDAKFQRTQKLNTRFDTRFSTINNALLGVWNSSSNSFLGGNSGFRECIVTGIEIFSILLAMTTERRQVAWQMLIKVKSVPFASSSTHSCE